MKKQKRYYSKEFKLQAISMAEERENVSATARELDIRPDILRRWMKEYQSKKSEAFTGTGRVKNRNLSEIQRLKRDLKEMTLERDILKKAVHIFSKSDRQSIDLS